ncbi:unnamed protein product [Arctia plantaginis]|uniref:Uncharacterized protein n=1 Tax=Arctia plantaginis TaxID=874455 RepID=A0A8S1BPD1_ARCPL|nr:unnamed protein product [Arctia plantaginis]
MAQNIKEDPFPIGGSLIASRGILFRALGLLYKDRGANALPQSVESRQKLELGGPKPSSAAFVVISSFVRIICFKTRS